MSGFIVRSTGLTEAFDPDSNKPFLRNQYTVLQNIAELLSPGCLGYLDTSHLQILLGTLVPLSIPWFHF